MKLYTTDNSELMDISSIKAEGAVLIVEGKIMDAIPVKTVVKPAEIRAALKLMSFKTMLSAFFMLFRCSR